ncbi:MAG: hypothetical protein WKF30_10625 [Pyrinomonadaceae bacterium]
MRSPTSFLARAQFARIAALIAAGFSFYLSYFATPETAGEAIGVIHLDSRSLGVLLVVWSITALLYPRLQSAADWFVDKVVLRRVDYAALRLALARDAQDYESTAELLDDVCLRLQPALTARAVIWREGEAASPLQVVSLAAARRRAPNKSATVTVPTTDNPRYELPSVNWRAGAACCQTISTCLSGRPSQLRAA